MGKFVTHLIQISKHIGKEWAAFLAISLYGLQLPLLVIVIMRGCNIFGTAALVVHVITALLLVVDLMRKTKHE